MKKYIYTHKLLNGGNVEFRFDHRGLLIGFDINTELDHMFTQRFIENIPLQESYIQSYWGTRKGGSLIEVRDDVDFNRFYERYASFGGPKKNKLPAEKLWDKMSQKDRNTAYYYIHLYFATKPSGVAVKYPDTYLRNKPWQD